MTLWSQHRDEIRMSEDHPAAVFAVGVVVAVAVLSAIVPSEAAVSIAASTFNHPLPTTQLIRHQATIVRRREKKKKAEN